MVSRTAPVAAQAGVNRIVVFVNGHSVHSLRLAEALARCVARESGFEIVAVVEASAKPPPPGGRLAGRRLLRALAQRVFEPEANAVLPRGWMLTVGSVARRARAPLWVPDGRDVNHPEFVSRLRHEHPGTVAVVFECLQVFGPDLLACFDMAINYHNGRLPDYRGLGATSWSVYRGEDESGFTFHRMDAGIDTGPILVTGSVRVGEQATTATVEAAKTSAAVTVLPRLLETIRRRDPGRLQDGPGSYFSGQHLKRMRKVDRPDLLSGEELRRRLRAFGVVSLTVGDEVLPVTAVIGGTDDSGHVFLAADGEALAVHRVLHVPPSLYRLLKPWTGRWRR